MTYKTTIQGSLTTLELSGEIDLQTSPSARDQILGLLKAGRDVLVSMAVVEYIDSSGIASLVEAMLYARDHQRVFVLAEVNQTVRQVFELARLDKVFKIYNTIQEAREAET